MSENLIPDPKKQALLSAKERLKEIKRREIFAEKAEESLAAFARLMWEAVEPDRPCVWLWFHDAIAEHLEAVERGEIRNLCINIPPRSSKSLLCSVFFPMWSWARDPRTRWIFASYSLNLSVRDSLKCRRIMEHPTYRDRWGKKFSIRRDMDTKSRYDNDQGGFRMSTSVGGGLGEGGDFLVADDPHSVNEALSDSEREQALVWWDETMSPRAQRGKVIVMQRLHESDLSGHVLQKGGYEHLCLPFEFEEERRCRTSIGFVDKRERDGEWLMSQDLVDIVYPEGIEALKRDFGSWGWASQMQQRPSARGAGMFDRSWFEIVHRAPKDAKKCRYWDMAATKETAKTDPDYTVGALVSLRDGVYYIEDIVRVRGTPRLVEDTIRRTAERDGPRVPIFMEQEPGSAGKTVIDHYMRHVLAGHRFDGDRPTGSKESRADQWSAAAEAGNVKLVFAEWNRAFLDEVDVFPVGKKDQVDAVSGAVKELAQYRPKGAVWGRRRKRKKK